MLGLNEDRSRGLWHKSHLKKAKDRNDEENSTSMSTGNKHEGQDFSETWATGIRWERHGHLTVVNEFDWEQGNTRWCEKSRMKPFVVLLHGLNETCVLLNITFSCFHSVEELVGTNSGPCLNSLCFSIWLLKQKTKYKLGFSLIFSVPCEKLALTIPADAAAEAGGEQPLPEPGLAPSLKMFPSQLFLYVFSGSPPSPAPPLPERTPQSYELATSEGDLIIPVKNK